MAWLASLLLVGGCRTPALETSEFTAVGQWSASTGADAAQGVLAAPGVHRVSVDHDRQLVTVTYEPQVVDPTGIEAAAAEAGVVLEVTQKPRWTPYSIGLAVALSAIVLVMLIFAARRPGGAFGFLNRALDRILLIEEDVATLDEWPDDYEDEPPLARGGHEPESSLRRTVIVARPRSMDDAAEVAEEVKRSACVILDVRGLDEHVAQRVVDFIGGVVFLLDGSMSRVHQSLYLCAPPQIDVRSLTERAASPSDQEMRLSSETPAEAQADVALRRAGGGGPVVAPPAERAVDTPDAAAAGRRALAGPVSPAPEGRGMFPATEPTERDAVDCTVFAPREARAGDAVLLQVFAHLPTRARSARRLAQEFDATAERRGFTPLGTEVPRGATLAFELVMRELRVHDTRQELVWHGRADSVQFDVEVPADARVGNHNGTIYVAQDGNPIGHVTFQLKVLAQSAAADSTRVPTGTGKRYQRAFISYAREDLDEVLKRVQGLTAVGVTYRQDVFDLLPGDPWWATIVGYIDESDVFVLFWSTAAKRSRWVKREWTYALERPSEDFIRPWLIEGPPIPAPPSQLQHLHFDDKSLHYR